MECTPNMSENAQSEDKLDYSGKRFINCSTLAPKLKDYLGLPICFGKSSADTVKKEKAEREKDIDDDLKIEAEISSETRIGYQSRIMGDVILGDMPCTAMSNTKMNRPVKIVISQAPEETKRVPHHMYAKHTQEQPAIRDLKQQSRGICKTNYNKRNADPLNSHSSKPGEVYDERSQKLNNDTQQASVSNDKNDRGSQSKEKINKNKHSIFSLNTDAINEAIKKYKPSNKSIAKDDTLNKDFSVQKKMATSVDTKPMDRKHYTLHDRKTYSPRNHARQPTSNKYTSIKRIFKDNTKCKNMKASGDDRYAPTKRTRFDTDDTELNKAKEIMQTTTKPESTPNTTSTCISSPKETGSLIIDKQLETENTSVKQEFHNQSESRESDTQVADLKGPIISNVFSLQDSNGADMDIDKIRQSAETKPAMMNKESKQDDHDSDSLTQKNTTATETVTGNMDSNKEVSNGKLADTEKGSAEATIDNLISVTSIWDDTHNVKHIKEEGRKKGIDIMDEVPEEKINDKKTIESEDRQEQKTQITEEDKQSSMYTESPKKSNENARFKIIKSREKDGDESKETISDGCFACDICSMNIFKRKYDLLVHKANYHWS